LMLSCNSTSFEKNACTSLAPCPDRQWLSRTSHACSDPFPGPYPPWCLSL
jgi:hypothetical protein